MAILTSMEMDCGQQRFALAAQASLDGFWETDPRTGETRFSPQWQRIAGLEAEEHTATMDHWLDRVHPEDRPELEQRLTALRGGKIDRMESEHRLRHENGRWRWVTARAIAQRDAGGAGQRIAGTMTDQTDRKLTDPATGLPNRLFFIDYLERRFDEAQRSGNWNFAVLSLGLERFKLVNEQLGYEGGDALLAETAARIQAVIEACGCGSVPARLTAADLLVCLENKPGEAQAMEAARVIGDRLRQPFQWRGHTVSPSAALGLAMAGPGVLNAENLMRDADTAHSAAREKGRGHLVCYSQGMRERALARMRMEADLEQALRNHANPGSEGGQTAGGRLVLHYQPEIDLESGRIIGFEALVRWHHPERGLVMPNEFIPLAEETDLILPLGDWGLAEACRQIGEWRELVRKRNPQHVLDLRVSVNLSAKQFGRPGLVACVAEALERAGISASDLRLEVTESSLMSHEDTAQDTMQGLQKLGVGLHMDDFGTGYSSLNHLHRYPFDTLKIDRSFVQAMEEGKSSTEIIRTILGLARSLDMEAVAEGIETAEQAARLQSLGCKLGQGYYFARPMDPEAVTAMLAA